MSRFIGSIRDKMSKKSSSPSAPSAPSFNKGLGINDNSNNPYLSASSCSPKNSVPNIEEAPPAYEASAPPSRPLTPSTDDDPYAFLSAFDTVFLIDDSGSMAGTSWSEVSSVLANIAPICTKRDKDGIDVHFLNHRSSNSAPDQTKPAGGYYNLTSASQVRNIFSSVRPSGRTPTGERLGHILSPYNRHLQRADNPDTVRPVNIIIITDGCPTDYPDEIIRDAAGRLDRLDAMAHQVGLQFFQVGRDMAAAEHLRQLDDELGDVRDMVDTVTWDGNGRAGAALSADAILKVVLGAVVRRLDRRNTGRQSPRRR